jgi:hypothetical protein
MRIRTMNRSLAFTLLIAAAAHAGCGTTSILAGGTNTTVRYQQIDRQSGTPSLELVLVEESHKDYQDLYSMERRAANTKKVPTETFEDFMRILEDLGFLEIARPLPSGVPPRLSGISKALIVESDQGQWVASNPKEMSLDDRRQFKLMCDLFRNCFDSIFSLQVIQNTQGKELFLEEQQRIEQENRENIQRIEEENRKRTP